MLRFWEFWVEKLKRSIQAGDRFNVAISCLPHLHLSLNCNEIFSTAAIFCRHCDRLDAGESLGNRPDADAIESVDSRRSGGSAQRLIRRAIGRRFVWPQFAVAVAIDLTVAQFHTAIERFLRLQFRRLQFRRLQFGCRRVSSNVSRLDDAPAVG